MRFATLLVVVAFLAAALPSEAGSILNGSFESGVSPGSFTTLSAGNPGITNWTIDSGNLDYIGSYWGASDGSRSLDLNGTNSAVTISQDFATVIGETYFVSFFMAGNPDGPPDTKTLRVSAAGAFADFSQAKGTSKTTAGMGWTEKQWSFTAISGTTTLAFRSLDSGSYGAALDDVRVTAAPLPSAAWAGFGLLALLGVARRRSRRAE